MILLIDNYDSFVFNLARYVAELGYEYQVVRNDEITLDEIAALSPSHIILSPGPCSPNEAGISLALVSAFLDKFPILGVCLGHQAIGQACGGKVVRATTPKHGKSSQIFHDGQGLFQKLPNPFKVARYHSLIVENDSLPSCLKISARTKENEIMAIEHREYPVFGVQFHPESVLTEHGHQMLSQFLAIGFKGQI
ncbi:glutamine amidotransferase-related protein [Candidatus Berkiella aquae]|uniref:Aminodeoxychorismate synthase component 2 n=1 Tax=Candidatus Berkiella aquae TaxID=295108 RepID=A0A0Q9YPR3_9GAMM|nr:aminodeoxychorismate/anthranilate synthase component II [Candidatus Berkiella aquae]MCS5711834.1 aminodeoxychorismate/anthranilate synthase component II [Candidatus Berkiella aquae]